MPNRTTIDPAPLEIAGPSALGSDPKRLWDLLWLTTKTSYRLRYHGSLLGYVWSLLHPLLLFGVIFVVFTLVLRFGDRIPHYGVLLLLNIMLFGFFSDATTTSVQSLVSGVGKLRGNSFPQLVIPMSVVGTSMLVLITNLPVAFIFMLVDGVNPMWTWLLLPVILVLLLCFTFSVALILSTLYVTLRDVALIWNVAIRALFYGSAVVFTIDFVPESWRWIVAANPIVPILTQARVWIIDPSAPSALEACGTLGLGLSICVFVVVLATGLLLFVRRAPRTAELL